MQERAPRCNIKELMERWARWSSSREGEGGLGWPHTTITGRLLRDMPTTRCPTCDGHGRIPGSRAGSLLAFLTCPMCSGGGKVDADPRVRGGDTKPCRYCKNPKTGKPTGEKDGKTCVHCRGSGNMPTPANHEGRTPSSAANPAYIKATKQGGYIEDDPTSQRIDWLICTAITEDERVVVMHEYRWSRTRLQALARLKVGDRYFRETLTDALTKIEAKL